MPSMRHTHKYMRQQLSKYNIGWRCVRDACTHFLPANVENTIVGRMSICWNCGHEFRMTEESIKNDMPQCYDCDMTPDQLEAKRIADAWVRDMESGIGGFQRIKKDIPTPISPKPVVETEPRMKIVKKHNKKEPQLSDEIEVIEPVDNSEQITDDFPWLQGEDNED